MMDESDTVWFQLLRELSEIVLDHIALHVNQRIEREHEVNGAVRHHGEGRAIVHVVSNV
jgi:hypothetical protein